MEKRGSKMKLYQMSPNTMVLLEKKGSFDSLPSTSTIESESPSKRSTFSTKAMEEFREETETNKSSPSERADEMREQLRNINERIC